MTDISRKQFEMWIGRPPFELSVARHPDDPDKSAWPGNYKRLDVQLAWCAWQDSRAAAVAKDADENKRLRSVADKFREDIRQLWQQNDKLVAENATLRNAQKACADCDEPTYLQWRDRCEKAEFDASRFTKRATEAEAALAAAAEREAALTSELMEWQTSYIHDGMAGTWRRRYWVVKKLLDDMRGAVEIAHEALRFAWGGEPMGTLEQEAMHKMGIALRALNELNATEPRKP